LPCRLLMREARYTMRDLFFTGSPVELFQPFLIQPGSQSRMPDGGEVMS
jgi:hypothetical protein